MNDVIIECDMLKKKEHKVGIEYIKTLKFSIVSYVPSVGYKLFDNCDTCEHGTWCKSISPLTGEVIERKECKVRIIQIIGEK